MLYLALHPAGEVPMVGASGAICGLWGAASRLADADGRLTGLVDRQVGLNLRNFTLMNLILVALVSGPQLLFGGGEAQGGIAWEGHVGGYLVGLLRVRGQVLLSLDSWRCSWGRRGEGEGGPTAPLRAATEP